jgi:TonB family protein
MATPVVYRVPRRFITFPQDPPPYGFVALSFLAHVACFGAAVALSAFISSQAEQSKVYIVNLVPATPSLGSPEPVVKAPAPRPAPPAPAPKAEQKAPPKPEEKAPPKATRPEPAPPRPARAPERTVEPPPRTAEVPAPRPKAIDPAELALPKRVEKESPTLPSPASKAVERTLLPPPPVTPPAGAPATPAAPRLPEPPRIASPPAAPAVPPAPAAPPTGPTVSRAAPETVRPGQPNASTVSGSNLSVDASDFPFTYYIRQLHAKVSEHWRRPPLVSTEQTPVMIYFEIDREGQVRGQPKIKQSSGNELYDQSALRAVLESIPFPPLPRDFPGQYLKVNFGFNPGLDKG